MNIMTCNFKSKQQSFMRMSEENEVVGMTDTNYNAFNWTLNLEIMIRREDLVSL